MPFTDRLFFQISRGKKIFRPYTSASDDDNEHDIPAGTQRTLRRQAGATAARPLTRSSLQPRLLFPSETQRRDREVNVDVDDEEALTDIDSAVGQDRVSTPPSTSIAPSGNGVVESEEVGQEIRIYEDDVVRGRDEGGETMTTSPAATAKGRKKKAARGGVASPFDSWPRTKVGRKRAGDEVVSEVTKRMRSGGGGGTFAGR
ncbi:MAG: hypothetical protein FE78DRAFT_32670 [Acidomyces sp. 'richmondensis']|nr:MAG: hypothetical protein FE78DRAFT_32670 [Acidomyces sp. 'richmondensis']